MVEKTTKPKVVRKTTSEKIEALEVHILKCRNRIERDQGRIQSLQEQIVDLKERAKIEAELAEQESKTQELREKLKAKKNLDFSPEVG